MRDTAWTRGLGKRKEKQGRGWSELSPPSFSGFCSVKALEVWRIAKAPKR